MITFDDSVGTQTGILEEDEVETFVWITNPFIAGGLEFRTLLFQAPDIDGFVDGWGISGDRNWVFGEAVGSATGSPISPSAFTYEITGLTPPSTVPLPAAGWLMIGGIAGLATLRRRRRAVA